MYCHLSSKFQNRIMIESGRIKKIIATDSESLSIQIEDLTGQAFIFSRDPSIRDVSVSVISDTGVVQDILINFIDRSPEVIILSDSEKFNCDSPGELDDQVLEKSVYYQILEAVLQKRIPAGYISCSVSPCRWIPKKGIELTLKARLEGVFDTIYVYEAENLLKQQQSLMECELECEGCEWVYLQTNNLNSKQKILSVVAVRNYE